MKVMAYSTCPACHGTGEVVDYVPYGDTSVPMPSACDDCISRAISDGLLTEDEQDFYLVPNDGG